MLSVFYGNDTVAVRKHAHAYCEELLQGGGELTMLTLEDYSTGVLGERAEAVSLFGGEEVVLIDTFSEDKTAFEDLLVMLPALNASTYHFVVIEGKLLAPIQKQFAKHAIHCEECSTKADTRFNTFAMADALVRRDKRTLWTLFEEAQKEGIGAEEIIGVFLWQLKMLRLAANTKTAEEAGQKSFAYNKAKRALSTLPHTEVLRLTKDLLALYHEGHQGTRDLQLGLERFVLSL